MIPTGRTIVAAESWLAALRRAEMTGSRDLGWGNDPPRVPDRDFLARRGDPIVSRFTPRETPVASLSSLATIAPNYYWIAVRIGRDGPPSSAALIHAIASFANRLGSRMPRCLKRMIS